MTIDNYTTLYRMTMTRIDETDVICQTVVTSLMIHIIFLPEKCKGNTSLTCLISTELCFPNLYCLGGG